MIVSWKMPEYKTGKGSNTFYCGKMAGEDRGLFFFLLGNELCQFEVYNVDHCISTLKIAGEPPPPISDDTDKNLYN